jgi:superoxide dismutase, Fe-Mn family
MRSAVVLTFAFLLGSAPLLAQSQLQATTSPALFKLAALPYAADALEPVIDAETMALHHGKHHQAYVDGLNKAIAAEPKLAGQSLEVLIARAGSMPPAARNNGGGHWNHSFFWSIMAPPGSGGAPSPELAKAIDAQFGSMDAMKAAFKAAGTGRFGSGWAWLIVGTDGKLKISSTPNQDNPLMDVAEVKGTPVLGNDLWEHAYYLKHRSRRADYLDAWWQVVNWSEVSRRYAEAMKARG